MYSCSNVHEYDPGGSPVPNLPLLRPRCRMFLLLNYPQVLDERQIHGRPLVVIRRPLRSSSKVDVQVEIKTLGPHNTVARQLDHRRRLQCYSTTPLPWENRIKLNGFEQSGRWKRFPPSQHYGRSRIALFNRQEKAAAA